MKLVRRNHHTFPGFSTLFNDFLTTELRSFPTVGHSTPAVNIKNNQDDFQLEVAVPGLSKDQVKIEVEKDLLTLSSQIETKDEDKKEEGGYTRREFRYQSFKRAFSLPDTVDTENISANFDNGILTVVLPKKEEAKDPGPRMIEIG
ncbi:MAG: Hsp20/alpha crystallin family protein [Bacteroidota bacterium]